MPTGARLARTSDVDAIAEVQIRAWRTQYAGLLGQRMIDGLDAQALADAWGDAILRPPSPRHRVLVATDGAEDSVVGYAAVGPGEDPGDGASTGQLHDLVIDPQHQGQGHGSRLMAAAVDTMRAAGFTEAVTWIATADDGRRRFLESGGWGPDGAFRELADADAVVRQIRLVTDIAD